MVNSQPIALDESFTKKPAVWLAQQMKMEMSLLLAHTETGVIWGKWANQELKLSCDKDVFPKDGLTLDVKTLLDVRVFGPAGELFVWREGAHFAARLIADGTPTNSDAIEETYWLWGDHVEKLADQSLNIKNGFTMLAEGAQGLRHAPPMIVKDNTRLGLRVRHYIAYDEQGCAYIDLSRLVNLEVVKGGKHESQA